MCKWGHPVATLPNAEGDNTSLLQSNVNSANLCRGGAAQPERGAEPQRPPDGLLFQGSDDGSCP
eukprot:6213644-Pleurochrysis_carterae.AAC.6